MRNRIGKLHRKAKSPRLTCKDALKQIWKGFFFLGNRNWKEHMIYTLLTWGLAWISRSPHLLAHPGKKRKYGLDSEQGSIQTYHCIRRVGKRKQAIFNALFYFYYFRPFDCFLQCQILQPRDRTEHIQQARPIIQCPWMSGKQQTEM